MRGPERFVPDASVILKWVLDADDEPNREEAGEILRGWKTRSLELMVPSLWIYEVGNILCLKRSEDAEEILGALCALEMPESPMSQELTAETVAIAVGYGVTYYDASYLAVARLNKATLITADARFIQRSPEDAPVRLLGDKSRESSDTTTDPS